MNERESTAKRFFAHDILLLRDEEAFVSSVAPEPWVEEVLKETLTVVVRRGPRPGLLIPVGVRGKIASQRCAGFISPMSVLERIRPEQLVEKRAWRSHSRRNEISAFRHLEIINHVWESSGILWGPIGGIGFELVTGLPISTEDSDLDLIIRAEQRISTKQAQQWVEDSESKEIRVNIHLETPLGGVTLHEFIRRSPRLLVHTDTGPKLIHDPWGEGIS
jgi:phosphoribosyl-dephospho-CoA transferase